MQRSTGRHRQAPDLLGTHSKKFFFQDQPVVVERGSKRQFPLRLHWRVLDVPRTKSYRKKALELQCHSRGCAADEIALSVMESREDKKTQSRSRIHLQPMRCPGNWRIGRVPSALMQVVRVVLSGDTPCTLDDRLGSKRHWGILLQPTVGLVALRRCIQHVRSRQCTVYLQFYL